MLGSLDIRTFHRDTDSYRITRTIRGSRVNETTASSSFSLTILSGFPFLLAPR